ncbi:MAG: hypothetical protein DMF56_26580 [Acidobacteria bacterium]|nr:MAG: hypothetical protein DMF56_26580 [Acidobacteriota bacterium]
MWVLGAIVCVFVITLFFRPLAPRMLIVNPLFAIGFGAPLVLAILLFAWLFLLRFGVLQPLVLWPMLVLSIVCARNLHQNAPA